MAWLVRIVMTAWWRLTLALSGTMSLSCRRRSGVAAAVGIRPKRNVTCRSEPTACLSPAPPCADPSTVTVAGCRWF